MQFHFAKYGRKIAPKLTIAVKKAQMVSTLILPSENTILRPLK
jgi:hypothetical protein